MEPQAVSKCPKCASEILFKDGLRYLQDGAVQRWLCRTCGFRFSFSNNPNKLCLTKKRNSMDPFPSTGNENMLLSEVAKMTKTELLREGDLQSADTRAELIQFAVWLRSQGRAEDTAFRQSRILRILWQRGADLGNPESVKKNISLQDKWCQGRKENAVNAYTNLLIMQGKEWNPPQYRRIQKIPFIPQEKEINDLIAGCGNRTSAFLQLLKETGIRAGEAWQIKWTDIDIENRIVRVTPEKGSNPRAPKISEKLLAMLQGIRKNTNRVFGNYTLAGFSCSFQRQRKRTALKLQNPRIAQITFHTFRHWKATMEYHRTKDILYVMRLLGHKNIKNTLVYTQLMPFKEDDQFICKVATNTAEACKLIEDGFTFITGEYDDGGKIFRKPK
jgi:integrase